MKSGIDDFSQPLRRWRVKMPGGDVKRLLIPTGYAGFGFSVFTVALASVVGWPFRASTDPDNLTMVYLTAVVAVALRHGLAPALLATVLSVAAFNFLFIPPYYTFETLSPASYLTFGIMLVSSLLASLLASGLAARLASANKQYAELRHLLEIAEALLQATDRDGIGASITGHIHERFGAHSTLLPAPSDGTTGAASAGDTTLEVPVMNGAETLAALRLEWPSAKQVHPSEQLELETIAALTAGTLLRLRQAEFVNRTQAEKESERLRSLLLSSLGHDLRTPLTILSGTVAGLLRLRRKLPREALDDVVLLSRQIDDLQHFVGNLLRMASISSGQLALNLQPYEMQELVGVALKRVEAVREQRQVRIEIIGPIPLVEVDGALVEQVLINLLENAVKHTSSNGILTLRLECSDGRLATSIIDDGPGFKPGEDEAIFQHFQMSRNLSSDRSSGGHGLGLAICRGIVEAHGGSICAFNRQDEQGACVRFTLPFAALHSG